MRVCESLLFAASIRGRGSRGLAAETVYVLCPTLGRAVAVTQEYAESRQIAIEELSVTQVPDKVVEP